MRVVFFGMSGQFSLIPLQRLLATGVEVGAVVVPATQSITGSTPRRIELPSLSPLNMPGESDLPMIDPYLERNIVSLAWTHGMPVWAVDTLTGSSTLTLLSNLQPDLIVVACFPHIFPPALLQWPRHGCLNLHPSLLPAYRGPVPLFWIARQDERITGVTLHYLDEGLDSGDIVAQSSFKRPDGLTGTDLDRRCAEEGARLLQQAVQQLEQGQLPRCSQTERKASYFSWPGEEDFIIPTGWSARRAFNFLRGAEDWPLVIDVGEVQLRIRVAISYAAEQTLEQPYIVLGDELWVQFRPGVVRAKIYGD
jgi:methionyl-tRNA formyltransferase